MKHQPDNPMRCRSVSLSCKGKINHLIRLPEFLKSLAGTDHQTAKRYQIPSRFKVSYTDGTVKENVTQLSTVTASSAFLFEEMFANIEADLPPLMSIVNGEVEETKQRLPKNPLCVVTILYEDEKCNITAVTTETDLDWISGRERLYGR